MKPRLSSRTVSVAITAFLLAGSAAVVLAQTRPVNPIDITVTPVKRTTYGAVIPQTNVTPETRTEKLKITLQNMTKESYSDLTVRYCIFEQDVQNQKIGVALQHDTPITIPALTTLIITSQVANITYTPTYTPTTYTTTTTKQKATKKGGPATVTTTPVNAAPVNASGKQFAGYGIQVLQTNLVAGQYFGPLHSTNLIVGQLFSSTDLTNQFKAAFKGAKMNP